MAIFSGMVTSSALTMLVGSAAYYRFR